jgi:hypothetical protein
VLTVIVAVPAATAVTTPLPLTVAIAVSLLVQITFLFVAFAGVIVAVRVSVPPGSRDSVVVSRLTPVTATSSFPEGFSQAVTHSVIRHNAVSRAKPAPAFLFK